MAFQRNYNMWMPQGLSGQLVSMEGFIPTPYTYLSDGTVEVGSFAFEDTDKAGYAVKSKASARLLGFVVRNQNTFVNTPLEGATSKYPNNVQLTIAQRGVAYYVLPSGASNVTNGQSILCNPADGAVTFGEAGTANDTGWVVCLDLANGQTTAKEGDLVRIQNIGLNNKPTA